jgi:hypothetical protein
VSTVYCLCLYSTYRYVHLLLLELKCSAQEGVCEQLLAAVMFSEMLQMISALPLLVKGQGKVALKRGGYLSWAEFGEVDRRKVKHTILYFHGAPGCRFEPVMHSSSSYDKRANECISTGTLENIDKNNHPHDKKTSYDNVDEKSDELDVYAQRGIRLICIERPGFGDSTYLENRTVADYVDDVVEIVNSEEICLCDSSVSPNEKANERLNSDDDSKNGRKSASQMSDVNNISTSSEITLKNGSNSPVKNDEKITEEKKIYVIGYSAGGPYALAMRSLFEKKQLQSCIKNKAESESELQSESGRNSAIKIAAVCVVASSVGAAENIPYRKSTEGEMLNLFFCLPVTLQSVLYSGSISAFLGGLNASLFCLSWFNSLIKMTDFSDGKSKLRNIHVNKSENKSENNSEKSGGDENTGIKERKSNTENNNSEYIENLISKISAIQNAISHSIRIHGGRAMVTDTLTTQWGGRPWGFDLSPVEGDNLPPVLFFYSKEDHTVPPETGVFFCEKTMGCGEPIWLSGGHSCYILHLEQILNELLKYE